MSYLPCVLTTMWAAPDMIFLLEFNVIRLQNSKLDVSFSTTQYLSLLCELFSWNYTGVYTPNVHLRYAHAVTQCLRFVGDKAEYTDLSRMYGQFPALIRSDHRLEEVHLNCAIALLPHACYDLFLVDFMKTFNFSSFVLAWHHDKTAILSDQIKMYLQVL